MGKIWKVLGPIGNPKAKMSKRLQGFDPDLTSSVKKPRVLMIDEEGTQSSSSSYVPGSYDEEVRIPHVLVKRDAGPSALFTATSPAVAPSPVASSTHVAAAEHAPIVDDNDDPLSVNINTTLAAFLANLKATAFQPEPP